MVNNNSYEMLREGIRFLEFDNSITQSHIETDAKKNGLAQKLAISKKSTILIQSS